MAAEFDIYAPAIPALMRRLAEIQRGERVSVRDQRIATERRLETELRPAQRAGKTSARPIARGGGVRGSLKT